MTTTLAHQTLKSIFDHVFNLEFWLQKNGDNLHTSKP